MFSCEVQAISRALSSFIRAFMGELPCAFFRAVKTHRYETIWLPPSHPYFRSRALFFQGSCLAKQILPWYRSLISRAGLTKKKIRAKCWKPSAFVQCVFEASKKADVSCIVHARSRAQFFAIFHTFRLLGCVVCHVCSTSPTSGARALADAKLGQRSKSWCRIISRRLAGPEMQCHDLLKRLSYLWSCAPCTDLCLYTFSNTQ